MAYNGLRHREDAEDVAQDALARRTGTSASSAIATGSAPGSSGRRGGWRWTAGGTIAVYILVGAPFVVTNEWNPIIPMLPLALLTFLAMPLALGESRGLPIVVLLASVIVQTHVGYVAPIAALFAVVLVSRSRIERQPIPRTARFVTATVLVVCWTLPLYEAATTRPGNIQWLIEFFAPDNLAKQSWAVAWAALREQAAGDAARLVRAFHVAITPRPGVQAALFFAQCTLLLVVIATSVRSQNRMLTVLAAIPLTQWAVAMVAVRAIRQAMAFYLVAWISVIGLIAWIVVGGWIVQVLERWLARSAQLVGVLPAIVLAAALTHGVAQPGVFREPDVAAETLARDVEMLLRTNLVERPLVQNRITGLLVNSGCGRSVTCTKRGVPLYVADDWLYIVGRQFAAPPGAHPELHFASSTSIEQMPDGAIVSHAANGTDVVVYLTGQN